MSLQNDYRPRSFKTFVGNRDVLSSLIPVLKRPEPPDAFLFSGPGGTGKTTIARIIKRALKCADADFKELNAADDRGIGGIRKLIEAMRYAPLAGPTKVFLLDEAHMLTPPAQEALLKSLEEPPPYVHWVVCTTNPEVLKPTFKRRCHTYELEPLKDADLHKLMRIVLKKEDREHIDGSVREKIIELSDGSAGVALKLLDQIIDMDDVERSINTLQSAGTGEAEVIDICRTLVNYNMSNKNKWAKIKILLKNYKGDGESARRPILGYLEKVMVNNGTPEVFLIMQPFLKNFFDSGRAGLVSACYEALFGDEL